MSRLHARRFGSICRAVLLAVLCGAGLPAAEWQIEVVDPMGGLFSSLQFDKSGNAHVVHTHPPTRALKYGFWDRGLGKWFTTTLDETSGFCSLTLDSQQRPHVSYISYGSFRLKYARWDGTNWDKEAIQIRARQIDYYTSIALDPKDNPTISFYEYYGMGEGHRLNLRQVGWNGTAWEVRTIDFTTGSGKFNSIAIDSQGRPHVGYANVSEGTASVRYGRWNGQSWDLSLLEGGVSGYGAWSVKLALDKKDTPHIAYTDVVSKLVKYAVRRGDKWEVETVDAIEREGYPDRNGLALDDNGRPYISYYDAGLGQLRMAHKAGGRWITEVVDPEAAGYTSSIAISQDSVWITYSDEAQRLKMARRPLSLDDSAPQTSSAGVVK
jgi:hypothetical protein